MNIALDYDDTFTASPEFWKEVILLARKYGHKTRIVTMRHPILDQIPEQDELRWNYECLVEYTDGKAKRPVMLRDGFPVDIWIDDRPKTVDNDSEYTTDELREWREANARM
jgi:hypothetical protein